MDEPLVTEEDCHHILEKISPDYKLIKFSTRSLAGEVEGYLSSHFNLKITYQSSKGEESQTFFVKKLNNGLGFLTELCKSFDAFTKEIFFYQFYPRLEQMENFTQFAPKCYLCKEDLIVIEDLSRLDFKVTEQNLPFDLEECKMALKTLAMFHGSFIAFEEKHGLDLSLEYPRELRDVSKCSDETSPTVKYKKTSIDVILGLIDIIPNINKEDFKALVLRESASDGDHLNYKKCVLHCDLWSKNFMFQRGSDKITACRLIDFQLLNYSLPGYDLSLFLNANTSSEFRQQHKAELLQYYYTCLDSTLKSFGVDLSEIISLSDFLDGLILSEPAAKIFAFNDSAILGIPEEMFSEAFENTELMEDYMLRRRVNILVGHYKNDPEFRAWVDQELKELYDSLVIKKVFLSKNK